VSVGQNADLLIIGASARAAAHSALRAGLIPCALDYFNDLDLKAAGACGLIEPSSSIAALERRTAALPPCPWIYTGGFENHPEVVARLAQTRRLWGVSSDRLHPVRDPFEVARRLDELGFSRPELSRHTHGLPHDGTWLIKPLRSTGGRGIRALVGGVQGSRGSVYFQKLLQGDPLSAVFVAGPRATALIGVTEQILGVPGDPFVYRGSIGPRMLAPSQCDRVRELGEAVSAAFSLSGIFGVDFVLHGGEPWAIEINPRYTSSVEVLELASGRSVLVDHRVACQGGDVEPSSASMVNEAYVAKQILYAERGVVIEENLPLAPLTREAIFDIPELADIPARGSRFVAGEPVVTVFGRGATLDECGEGVDRSARRWSRLLRLCAP
jgi:uncharacterized protein